MKDIANKKITFRWQIPAANIFVWQTIRWKSFCQFNLNKTIFNFQPHLNARVFVWVAKVQTLDFGERKFRFTLRCAFWNHKRKTWNLKFDKKQTWEDFQFNGNDFWLLSCIIICFPPNEKFAFFSSLKIKVFFDLWRVQRDFYLPDLKKIWKFPFLQSQDEI